MASELTTQQCLDRLGDCFERVSEKKLADTVRQMGDAFAACKKKADVKAILNKVELMLVKAMERAHKWPPKKHDDLRSDLIGAFTALSEVAAPPPKPRWETTSGTFGGFKVDYVEGDPADAERVAKNSVKLARKFEERLIARDYEKAYAMVATSTREWMTLKRFISDHEKSTKQLGGGLPVSFKLEAIRRIYADAAARKEGNSVGQWPKQMPKEQKRATLQVFLSTSQSPTNTGCWSFLWIAEERPGVFSIAKTNYYLM